MSRSAVAVAIPAEMRPKGKNSVCQVLASLIEHKRVERINANGSSGISKKFSRYQLAPHRADGGAVFGKWPFVPFWHDTHWLERRARSRKVHKE